MARVGVARLIVGQTRAAGPALGGLHIAGCQPDGLGIDAEGDGLVQGALEHPAHGPLGDLAPHEPPLDLGHGGRFLGGGLHSGYKSADGGGNNIGFSQGGQHLIDVAQEHGGGSHDEHARPREAVAPAVEQERRPMKGHRGLAGTGATLHHEHTGGIGANDRVLFGLNGGDDVRHLAVTGLAHRGHEGTLTRQVEVVATRSTGVEQLVLHAGDLAETSLDVPPSYHIARLGGRGLIERLGLGRPPVQQDDLLGFVLQPDAADVLGGAVVEVETAEHQPILHVAQADEVVLVVDGERIALAAPAGTLDVIACTNVPQARFVAFALTVQRTVCRVDVQLFLSNCTFARPRRDI